VLVLSARAWLEVNAVRKHAHKEPQATAESHSAPLPEAAAYNDPFAAHAPAYAAAAAAGGSASDGMTGQAPVAVIEAGAAQEVSSVAVEEHSAVTVVDEAEAGPWPTSQAETTAAEAIAEGVATTNAEDEQVHTKAKRFARLLVDEIKLYNQDKVSEGRKNRDLYDRLNDTIEKSRATYQKRYGDTVAASGNYFQHELIRSLAEDDASEMGPNFHL